MTKFLYFALSLKPVYNINTMDHLTVKKRSWNMSLIKAKNSKPEVFVRSILHRLGFRFSLNKNDLPGKPDIVLKKYQTAVFIHGCFWHQHKNCKRANMPKSNQNYWKPKLARNVERDKINKKELMKDGWKVIVVWECEIKDPEKLKLKLIKKLEKGI